MTKYQRNYTAAQTVARYGDFTSSSGSADYELRNAIAELRRKTRFLARNSGTMKRYIQLMQDNIVGENGFSVQLGNQSIERAFADWCDHPTVDMTMGIVDFERLMVATWCRDGEFIFEFVRSKEFPDMLAINPIEADMLDETLNYLLPNGGEVRMGVELNAQMTPVAYWFLNDHPGDGMMGHNSHQRHRRVPAANVVHVFERLRPGQTRGEPPASASVNSIKMLDGYREAETMNRRIAAAMMGFFSRDLPKPEGIDAIASDVSTDEDGEELFSLNLEPGTLKQLPDGMRFDKFDPGGSQTDYAQFEAQVKKDLSMGLGPSVFSLGMETSGVSYSTGRSVLMEDRRFYRGKQTFFIRMAMRRIFFTWASMHMLSENSTIAPTRLAATMRNLKIRGQGWDWIDPAKDIDANVKALESLQTSHSRIAADRGMDIADLFAEIKSDRDLMAKFGLTVISGVATGNDPKVNVEDNDDED